MAADLTCGDTGSTAEDIINRVNEHDASINNTNLIINGNMLINQREFDGITWVDGQYSYDRWKATTAAMTQIIEDGSYKYNTIYTLSGIGITTQEITSPSSGHWTLPDIPRTAIKIKLEEGTKVTPYQPRLIGEELALCQRYYAKESLRLNARGNTTTQIFSTSCSYPVAMRISPSVIYSNYTVLGCTAGTILKSAATNQYFSVADISASGVTVGYSYAMSFTYSADSEL